MGSWVELNQTEFLKRSNADERANYEEAESDGTITSDKLCMILSDVAAFVHGRVASCGRNTSFGAAGTVPPECVMHALSIARHNLVNNHGVADIVGGGEGRVREYEDAMRYFDRVADCREVITPDSGTTGSHETSCYGSETQLDFSV